MSTAILRNFRILACQQRWGPLFSSTLPILGENLQSQPT